MATATLEPVERPRAAPDRRGPAFVGAIVLITILAVVLRAIPIGAALPYTVYVDEGHVVQPATHMITTSSPDPGRRGQAYKYPTLMADSITGVGEIARLLGASSVRSQAKVSDRSTYYDVIEPELLVVVGRILVLLSAAGTVVAAMLLAAQLVGRRAAVFAGLFVATAPALVSRSAIVIVDTPATFFVTLSLLFAAYAMSSPHRRRHLALAGVAAGLAFTTKYTAGLCVLVPMAVALGPRRFSLRQQLERQAWVVVPAAITSVVVMPGLLLSTHRVIRDLRKVDHAYSTKQGAQTTYLQAMVDRHEVGWLLVALAVVGLVLLVRAPRSRRLAIAWLGFAVLLFVGLSRAAFQPFRDLLPLVPFMAVAAAATVDLAAGAAQRRLRLSRTARLAGSFAIALVVALVGLSGAISDIRATAGVVDSRTQAVDWLQDHVPSGSPVLVSEQLAVLPSQLGSLPAKVTVGDATLGAPLPNYRYVVVGPISGAASRGWIEEESRLGDTPVASFGADPAPSSPGAWRGNRERVLVYRNG
jgi:hypothetical protein